MNSQLPSERRLSGPRSDGQKSGPEYYEPSSQLAEKLALARRNVWVILFAGLAGLLVAGWLVSQDRPVYRAVATIALTDERRSMTGGLGGETLEELTGSGSDPLLSQVQVLKSREIAGAVVDREGLRLIVDEGPIAQSQLVDVTIDPYASPDTLQLRFGENAVTAEAAGGGVTAPYGTPLVLDRLSFSVADRPAAGRATLVLLDRRVAIETLRENAEAYPRPKTNVVDVRYVGHDPATAQRVADALVEEFQRHSQATAQQQSRRRRIFVEEQLRETEGLLEDAQLALSGFRRREGMYSSKEMFAAQQAGMLQLDVRREELAADRRMLASLLDALEADGTAAGGQLDAVLSSPVLASSPVVGSLFTQLMEQQSRLDSLRAAGAATTHPDVRRYGELVYETRDKLAGAARSHLATLDARVAALDGLKERQEADIRMLPGLESEEARLAQQAETLVGAADLLRTELQKARIAEAVEGGQVQIVDRAALPLEPVGAGRTRKLLLGLLLGLMTGAGVAALRENLDTTIRQKTDIERVLGLSPLGVVPRVHGGSNGEHRMFPRLPGQTHKSNGAPDGRGAGRELVTVHDNRSSGAEAYRTLRTNLLFSQLGEELKTVVVTSAGEAEGKTTVASNLATTFAQQGVRVLVVDADLRKARLHRVFDLEQRPGLTEWVMDEVKVDAAIRETEVERLFVLPSGALPPNPSEILGSKKMRGLMETLREGFELVIFDTPPLMAAGDAAVLGARADGVVLVVRAGETEQGAAREAVRQLETVRARILGVVLNDPDSTAEQYGEYYHYAYYGD